MAAVRYIPLIDRGTKSRRKFVLALLFLLFACVILSVVLTTYYFYLKEGQRSTANIAGLNAKRVGDDAAFTPDDIESKDFIVDVELLDMDPTHSRLRLYSNVTRLRFSQDNGTLLLGSYKTIPLTPSSYYFDQELQVELNHGDINHYPYDKYIAEVPFAGIYGSSSDLFQAIRNTSIAPPQELQYAIIAAGHLQNWKFELKWETDSNVKQINMLKIIVRRSVTVKVFSIFVICLMWLISVSATLITAQIIGRNREVTPPIIAVMASLLFALPALRNVQPNIPPIGTVADVVGLFFNMGLISLCEITLMLLWLWQSPEPVPAKKEDENKGMVISGPVDTPVKVGAVKPLNEDLQQPRVYLQHHYTTQEQQQQQQSQQERVYQQHYTTQEQQQQQQQRGYQHRHTTKSPEYKFV